MPIVARRFGNDPADLNIVQNGLARLLADNDIERENLRLRANRAMLFAVIASAAMVVTLSVWLLELF
jgi:hypothetical protein